jgi:hypothetical protein
MKDTYHDHVALTAQWKQKNYEERNREQNQTVVSVWGIQNDERKDKDGFM